jgi:hypothetical protein
MPVGAKLFILIIIALVFLPFFIKEKIRKDKKLDRPFYKFGDYPVLVIAALASVALIIVTSNVTEVPRFDNPHEQVSYGKLRNRPGLAEDAYRVLLEKEPHNIDHHFEFVSAHYQGKMYGYNDDEYIPYRSDNSINNFYHSKTKSENTAEADLGHLMLGLQEYLQIRYDPAYNQLQKVQDSTKKYLNYLLGELYFYTDKKTAEEYYRKEIANRGYLKGAYNQLADLLYYYRDKDELDKLVRDTQGNIFVSWQHKQITSLRKWDLKSYFMHEFENLFRTANLVGAAGAFLIMLVWFLMKLESPVTIGQKHDHVLIRAKESGALLENGMNTIVHFTIIPSMEALSPGSKKTSDFQFVDWAIAN